MSDTTAAAYQIFACGGHRLSAAQKKSHSELAERIRRELFEPAAEAEARAATATEAAKKGGKK